MLTLRRWWARAYRTVEQIPLLFFFKKSLQYTTQNLRFTWHFPRYASRRVLQILNYAGYSRVIMHAFVLVCAGVFLYSGVLDSGQVTLASEQENRYVVPIGTSIDSNYSAYVVNGYLQENNTSETAISTYVGNSIQQYVVQQNDTIGSIAAQFQTTPRTVQWTNQIKDVYKLPIGNPITVFSGSGIIHTVGQGQDINAVASEHGVSVDDIIANNDLVPPIRLAANQRLVIPIPDARIPQIAPPVIAAPQSSSNNISATIPNVQIPSDVVGTGKFGWPAQGRITRGCRAHGPRDCAIDIANSSLPPIYAADDGFVVVAKWDSTGYGNRIDINHGNGFVTRYAHNQVLYVGVGERVSKGQVIAKMGNTGRSTGAHLHFMIINNGVPQDPLLYL